SHCRGTSTGTYSWNAASSAPRTQTSATSLSFDAARPSAKSSRKAACATLRNPLVLRSTVATSSYDEGAPSREGNDHAEDREDRPAMARGTLARTLSRAARGWH